MDRKCSIFCIYIVLYRLMESKVLIIITNAFLKITIKQNQTHTYCSVIDWKGFLSILFKSSENYTHLTHYTHNAI